MKPVVNQACENCYNIVMQDGIIIHSCLVCIPCEKYGICAGCCAKCSKRLYDIEPQNISYWGKLLDTFAVLSLIFCICMAILLILRIIITIIY